MNPSLILLGLLAVLLAFYAVALVPPRFKIMTGVNVALALVLLALWVNA